MPVQLRSRKRTYPDISTDGNMSYSASDTIPPAKSPSITMEMADCNQETLTKILQFYAPHVTNYLTSYNESLSVPQIMYVPFLSTLGVGPHISHEDLRPLPLKGVTLYDILKGTAYTALVCAKMRLITYYTAMQNQRAWPETRYPPQSTHNVPWLTRVDALEARLLIENGLDWCLRKRVSQEGLTFVKHAVGLWRALETALQIGALVTCLKTYLSHNTRLFKGLRQIRYAGQSPDYYAADDSSKVEDNSSNKPSTVSFGGPVSLSPASTDGPVSPPTYVAATSSVTDNSVPTGVTLRTIKIVRPDLTAYNNVRFKNIPIPPSMLEPESALNLPSV